MANILIQAIKCPRRILLHFSRPLEKRGFFDKWSDARWLKVRYWLRFGKKPDLDNPKTFNEKLQWLKLYDRKPEYTVMVDKHGVKKYVADLIGEEYVIPTLGVWDRFEDIDFDALPDRFVLKCTHDSGGLVICKNKADLDYEAARIKITQSLKTDYYLRMGREWPYKNVKPQIIAEQYIDDEPKDYKLFCFNGQPKMTLVCSERFSEGGLKEDCFDEEWNHMELRRPKNGNSSEEIPKPRQFERMMQLAAQLSAGIPFSRIDFYEIGDTVYFGEITFFPAGGFESFEPAGWDEKLGSWIQLPEKE